MHFSWRCQPSCWHKSRLCICLKNGRRRCLFAQGRPQNLAIPVSFFHAVERKEEREEISSFFLLSLDDVCRMKQFSLELVGKHRQEQMFLDFREDSGVVQGHLMPSHPSGYNRRNKKIEQSCVLVEQQWHDGSDSISNSEQQEAQLQLQEGYIPQISTGHFLCILYPWHIICCPSLSLCHKKRAQFSLPL